MARPYNYYNFYYNSLFINKNKVAKAFIKNNSTFTYIYAIFYILSPILIFIAIFVPVSINKLFK